MKQRHVVFIETVLAKVASELLPKYACQVRLLQCLTSERVSQAGYDSCRLILGFFRVYRLYPIGLEIPNAIKSSSPLVYLGVREIW